MLLPTAYNLKLDVSIFVSTLTNQVRVKKMKGGKNEKMSLIDLANSLVNFLASLFSILSNSLTANSALGVSIMANAPAEISVLVMNSLVALNYVMAYPASIAAYISSTCPVPSFATDAANNTVAYAGNSSTLAGGIVTGIGGIVGNCVTVLSALMKWLATVI